MEPRDASPAGPRWCECVSTHVPGQLGDEAEAHHVWPLGEGGPDVRANLRWLCPTTHTKVHNLWRAYARSYILTTGPPTWEIRRRYSPYVRALVQEGWDQARGARTIPREDTSTAEEPT